MVSVSVISRSYPAVAHTNVVAMFIASQLKSANACLGDISVRAQCNGTT